MTSDIREGIIFNNVLNPEGLIEHVKVQAEKTVFRNLSASSILFSVRVLDKEKETLDLVMLCSKKNIDDMPEVEESISIFDTIGGRAVIEKKPIHVPMIKDEPSFYPRGQVISSAGFKSMLALPLYIRDLVIGAVQIYTDVEEYEFNRQEMESISEFCALVVLMIIAERGHKKNARLMKRLNESEKYLQIRKHAASITHDIRNSLVQSIGGWANNIVRVVNGASSYGNLSDKEKLDKIESAASMIEKEAEGMSKRLSTILNYGSANEVPVMEQVGIFGFVKGIVNLFLQNGSNIEVYKGDSSGGRGGFDEFFIGIDKSQMEDVVRELLNNACRAVSKDEVKDKSIVCRVFRYKEDGRNSICIEIINEGVISEENLKHIFDPFFTLNSVGGTGLGLPGALVKVRAHGGKIKVHSGCKKVPEGYTSFRVYIPINQGD